MPVTSPQGTLDFKKVDKITFVGASSNTVIDTTTGSVGIGVVGDALSSNLHVVGDTRMEGNINMLHTSNTASIKLDSNVVTEFPRSKKLMKFPRVALTTAANNAYENGYKITYSNPQSGGYSGNDAFDGILGSTSGSLWYTGELEHYTGADGEAASTAALLDTNTERGEWLGIELPVAIKLQYFYLWQQPNDVQHFPKSGVVYAKKETNDSWIEIYRYDDRTRTHQPDVPEIFSDVNSEVAYKYFVLVCTKRLSQNLIPGYGVSIGEWQLFGVPEYDPEAHGTDVVVKSVPNVPNTDWLEVYFDAKGLQNGTVINPISGLGGTTINGTATNVTVSDGAFVFDGSSSYVTGGTPSISGNHHHSYSCWLKPTSANSGYRCIGYFINEAVPTANRNNTTTGLFLNNNRPVFLTWGNNLISDHTLIRDEWVHVTAVYDGRGRTIYVNSEEIDSDTYSSYNIDASATLLVGASTTTPGEVFGGSIANFRLFNRALTSDEIYQLYAYQKEYFGHSTNSMTLKAGRLGIGTSEPKAALDVRGTINANRFNTLVAEHTVTSTVDSVEFTGLDLFGDGGTYKILWKVKNPVSGNPQYYMTVNGDTTESNYWYGGKQHTNTEGLHDGNYPTIFRAGSESTHTLEITMTRSCDGYIVAHGQGTFHTGSGLSSGHVQGWELNRWFYKNPGNVTSILFSSANASTGKYGTGSNIQIHRYM